jgi:uncharacterized protein (DUF427 family)
MKAVWNNIVIAEAPKENLIRVEGNWYFPPSSLQKEYFRESSHHTTCPWKGEASYYDVVIDDAVNHYGAWYYPVLKDGAAERVRQDFTGYVAFWNGIEVSK